MNPAGPSSEVRAMSRGSAILPSQTTAIGSIGMVMAKEFAVECDSFQWNKSWGSKQSSGWCFFAYPSEKYEFVNWDDDIPN